MSDPKTLTALTSLEIERVVDAGHRPTLIEASLSSAKSISDTMTGVIQPQINTHSAAIAVAQGHIGTHGEAIASATTLLAAHSAAIAVAQGAIATHGGLIASAQTRLHAHDATLTGLQTHLTGLGDATARNDQAITAALLGEGGHIFRLDGAVVELARRVKWLEDHPHRGDPPPADGVPPEQAREMLEANEALRERVGAMEDAIRRLLAQGPQGGGPRSPRQR
jgi:hypothetical protein